MTFTYEEEELRHLLDILVLANSFAKYDAKDYIAMVEAMRGKCYHRRGDAINDSFREPTPDKRATIFIQILQRPCTVKEKH